MCRQLGGDKMMTDFPYNIGPLSGRDPIFINSNNNKVYPFDLTEKRLMHHTTTDNYKISSLYEESNPIHDFNNEKHESRVSESNDTSPTLTVVRTSSFTSMESDTVSSAERDDNHDCEQQHNDNNTPDDDAVSIEDKVVLDEVPEAITKDCQNLILDDCLNVEPDENDTPPIDNTNVIHNDVRVTECSVAMATKTTISSLPIPIDAEQEKTENTNKSRISFPAIKISPDEKIPINPKGPWRRLKRPNIEDRIEQTSPDGKIVLLAPIRLSVQSKTDAEDSCYCQKECNPKRRKQVRFDAVSRRSFAQTIGDNPSVTIGTPITLDWTYEDEECLPLDNFEQARMESRKKGNNRLIMHRLALNYYQRRNLLAYYAGCSEEEINQAEKEVARARWKRQMTAMLSDWWRVEDFVTSVGRKTKRLILGKR